MRRICARSSRRICSRYRPRPRTTMRRRRNRDQEVSYVIVERNEDSGVSAFVWGALIGAGIALLFAPKSGRDTRDSISQRARRLREAAEDTVRTVQDRKSVV